MGTPHGYSFFYLLKNETGVKIKKENNQYEDKT